VARILEARYLKPRSINSDLPRSIQRIIRKCLRKKPHRRYESMQELGRSLGKRIRGMDKAASLRRVSDFLVEAELVEAPPADETVVIYRAPGMGTFTRILVASAGLLVACAAGIALYSWITLKNLPVAPTAPPVRTQTTGTISRPTPTLSSTGTGTTPDGR
jgi:hypothetical protein